MIRLISLLQSHHWPFRRRCPHRPAIAPNASALARGTAPKVIKSTLCGQSGVTYVVGARSKRLMTVIMTTKSGSTFFNVVRPDSSEPVFDGFEFGNRFSFKVPKDGDYQV